MRLAALTLLVNLPLAGGPAADLAAAVRAGGFDRNECYRVRDLSLVREDIRIYLTDGHIIFSQPVAGRRVAAVFTADVEGGDGEVIILPPDRAERRSLAEYIHSPNLDTHFRTALFIFTGDEYAELAAQIPANPANKKVPEIGALMDERWTPVLHDISASYQTRIVFDLLRGPAHRPDLLAALFDTEKLGNVDVIYDPENPEQIIAGQIVNRDKRVYFDTWTSFQARSRRKDPAPPAPSLIVSDYRIEATVNPDLSMSVVTRLKARPTEPVAVAHFDISPGMTVSALTIDGQPAEIFQQDSLRSNLVRNGNSAFLAVPAQPLQPGREYEFEFHHSGNVIVDAGDRVFYVAARGNWYPMSTLQFATFDLKFRYPAGLDLVAPGDVVEDRAEGEWHITRRRTTSTIRTAAFNLGDYAHARLERGGYAVDVCANRKLERALQPRAPEPAPEPVLQPRRRQMPNPLEAALNPAPPPNPLARLQSLASDVASALEFMSSKFGPPALPHLTVSPIPGTFGQGFPGLIYLSTLSYLREVPHASAAPPTIGLFFEEVLQAHETAHQWWGNRITAATYRDYWLMEALANYSALLYLEKRKGQRALDQMLDSYRAALLVKNSAGETADSAGPIVLGHRLESSQQPDAWRAITYGKGSWIVHMLRRRMGDERFLGMLAELIKRYDHAELTTEDFRKVAARYLPPKSPDPTLESFFDQWVYGTGIPSLKLTYSVKGAAPAVKLTGTITQADVNEDFTALVPVEIQSGRGQTITRWIATGAEPATFSVTLKQLPTKVTLDPRNAVLRK